MTKHSRKPRLKKSVTRLMMGRPLPDREAEILKQPRIPVDSGVYVSEMRDRR